MPATKIRKKDTNTISGSVSQLQLQQLETATKAIKTYGNLEKQRQKENHAKVLKKLDAEYKSILAMIDKRDLEKTIGQVREEEMKRSSNSNLSNPKDEGYITEHHSGFSSSQSSKGSSLRSRSNFGNSTACSDAPMRAMGPPSSWRGTRPGTRRRSSSAPNGGNRVSRAKYKTPMMNKKMNNFPPITPKVTPNTPVTLLRRPRQGEMVMSLSGSPVLVNAISTIDEMANCNIPLKDGTMLSLMPSKLRQSSTFLPVEQMEPQTVRQLQSLHNNLGMIVKLLNKKHFK